MPAKSKKQRRFMGAELGRKKKGEATQTGMSTTQLEDFASTKEKGLPVTVKSHGRHSPEKKKKSPRHAGQTLRYV